MLEVAVFFIEGKVRRAVTVKKRGSETSAGAGDAQVCPPLNPIVDK